MPDRMWSLAEFRFDEAIEAAEVYLDSGTELELMARDESIAFAHERGPISWPRVPRPARRPLRALWQR